MTLNLLSGYATIRNRKKPILWTGMYAQHLSDRHTEAPETHPLLHVAAQQALQKAEIAKDGKNFIGLYTSPDGQKYFIPVINSPKFVIIKTCYFLNYDTMRDAKKAKGISGQKSQKRNDNPKVVGVTFDAATIATIEEEGDDLESMERIFVKWANSNPKRRKKLWDELRARQSL